MCVDWRNDRSVSLGETDNARELTKLISDHTTATCYEKDFSGIFFLGIINAFKRTNKLPLTQKQSHHKAQKNKSSLSPPLPSRTQTKTPTAPNQKWKHPSMRPKTLPRKQEPETGTHPVKRRHNERHHENKTQQRVIIARFQRAFPSTSQNFREPFRFPF